MQCVEVTIPEYFGGKNVLITGGTGFVGLILVEKLLRSCPQVGDVYLLLREKRGKTPQERIKEITDQELFDRLRRENGEAFKKLKLIQGNMTKLRLGISEKDEELLKSRVNIIYNVAASIRFDDHLRDALKINLQGTVELLKLALKCRAFEVFVHTSTSYCNTDVAFTTEEKVYQPPADWREMLELLDYVDPQVVEGLTVKAIHPLVNTYTFTKRLAEQAVVDMCNGKLNAVIIRPSIVTATLKEPICGWINSLSGPFALAVAGNIGLVTSSYMDTEKYLDGVYVDSVAKAMIIATKEKHMRQNVNEVTVYHATSDVNWKIKWFEQMNKTSQELVQFEHIMWLGDTTATNCWYNFYFWTCLQVVVASVIDVIIKLKGRSESVVKIIRKIYIANMVVQHFARNNFTFRNQNYVNLDSKLDPRDAVAFEIRRLLPCTLGETIGMAMATLEGIKRFALKEKFPPSENTKRMYRVFHLLHNIKIRLIEPPILYWVLNKYIFK